MVTDLDVLLGLPEQWEGVLVSVLDPEVSNPMAGYGEFEVTDLATLTGTLLVGDALHPWYGYGTLAVGDQFGEIMGPVSYAFGNYKVLPRRDSDVVP